MTSRRDALRKFVKGAAVAGSGGLLWGVSVAEALPDATTLRPPGALKPAPMIPLNWPALAKIVAMEHPGLKPGRSPVICAPIIHAPRPVHPAPWIYKS